MTRYLTESGSVYEVDTNTRRMRKLSTNVTPDTTRIPQDGAWRAFEEMIHGCDGDAIVFVWGESPEGALQTTVTTPARRMAEA